MVEILEDGDIYFLYRPRVGQEDVTSLKDVQRLLVVLNPWRAQQLRLLVVGRKRLPEIGLHDRFWGFVDEVVDSPKQMHETLGRRRYGTRTRGERTQPAARLVAEGAYVLARHDDHTHLAYQLEEPERRDTPGRDLRIEQRVSYVISGKNPQAASPPGVHRPAGKVELPGDLRERFGARRFIPLDPPNFLDHPGLEFLLVSAARDAPKELGFDLNARVERASRERMFRDLRAGRKGRPLTPIFAH